ncbi:ribosome maturation factor RimM [Eisenibacter elegans]|uniref:ribosome maturation factor RimM n=1 Tax=Eisenibacter elegans TaxID=997 RepID=UPI00040F285C|nr:ribosome maturation factor RimM [Eisenibacter elegans]
MPSLDDYYAIGHIAKTHALQGEVSAVLDVDNPADYQQLEAVLLMVRGALVPHFVERVRISGKYAIFKLEEVDTLEKAETLVGLPLYLPLTALPPLSDDDYYYHELVGFRVEDEALGDVGTVATIYDSTPQVILGVAHPQGSEVLVPAVDAMIQRVDKAARCVYVTLPDGLVDIYLQDIKETPDDLDEE